MQTLITWIIAADETNVHYKFNLRVQSLFFKTLDRGWMVNNGRNTASKQ